jgi:hypothetical protein
VVTCSPSAFPPGPVARHRFRAPPLPARLTDHFSAISDPGPSACSRVLRGIPGFGSRPPHEATNGSLSEFTPASGFCRRVRRAPPWRCHGARAHAVPPGVLAPTALEVGASTYITRVCLTRLRSASRVSRPSWRFPPLRPLRACFIPVALMGFDPSELFPLEEPQRLSAPGALLTFLRPARLAASSRCRHAQSHGSNAQVHRARPREPEQVAYRALLPSRVRCRPARV